MTMGIRKALVNRIERLQSLSHFPIDSLKENLEGDLSRKKKNADGFPNQGERSLRLVSSGGY